MIKVTNLVFNHIGQNECLNKINFEIKTGEIVGLVGEGKEEKSTLLKILAGQYPIKDGAVTVFNESPFSNKNIVKNIYYAGFENCELLSLKVKDYFKYISLSYPNYSKEEEDKLIDLLSVDKNKMISELSEDYLKRVELIAAISSRAKLIFIDDILDLLDSSAKEVILRSIKNYSNKMKVTVLFCAKKTDDFVTQADRVFSLKNTKVTELNKKIIAANAA